MGNMIDIDITLLVQFVNFVVTIVVLNYLLIKPVRDQISSRQMLLSGHADAIEDFNKNASEKISAYEAALEEARAAASVSRESLRNEGLTEEQQIIARANEDARAFLTDSRAKVAKESKAAMKTLLSQVNEFAGKAMAKILA